MTNGSKRMSQGPTAALCRHYHAALRGGRRVVTNIENHLTSASVRILDINERVNESNLLAFRQVGRSLNELVEEPKLGKPTIVELAAEVVLLERNAVGVRRHAEQKTNDDLETSTDARIELRKQTVHLVNRPLDRRATRGRYYLRVIDMELGHPPVPTQIEARDHDTIKY